MISFSSGDTTLGDRLASLNQRIQATARAENTTPPTLIAASKGQQPERLKQAIAHGIEHFGENRVQEAWEKWPQLKAGHPAVQLHLIGPLQSNKAREAVALFDAIHTIDRAKIADAVADEAARASKNMEYFIQVNIGEEPQKHGVMPREFEALLRHCREISGLTIHGLMAVPPDGVNPAPYFALLAKLAHRHQLPALSMGMSGDFETALRLGATHIRLGTALFGERPPTP